MSKSILSFSINSRSTVKYICFFLLAFFSRSCAEDGSKTGTVEVEILSEETVQSYIQSYVYANISCESMGQTYCDLDHDAIVIMSNVFKSMELYNSGYAEEAWDVLDNYIPKLEDYKYGGEICLIAGKTLGERDINSALILLRKALQKSRIKDHENRALEYSALNEIITLLSSSANTGNGKDYNVIQDRLAMKYAAEADRLLSDSNFYCYENSAAKSIYRTSTESIIWLGEDSIANRYIDCYLKQKEHYKDSEIAECYVDILNGVRAYKEKSYVEAEKLFKSGVYGIGKYDSYMNYSLELAYSYLSVIYYKIGDIERSIVYAENSIKCLQNSYYRSRGEEFKPIPIDKLQGSHYVINIISSYIRLQRSYMRALDLGVGSITIEDLSDLSLYVNRLIKWWCLDAADNKSLLFATSLIKQSNEVMIEATYNHSDNLDSNIDNITSMAAEASSFNLNYLIKLRNFRSNIEEDRSFNKEITELSLGVINRYEQADSITFDEILKKFKLFQLKAKLRGKPEYYDLVDNSSDHVNVKSGEAVIKYFVSYNYLFIIYHTSKEKGVKRVSLDDLEKNIAALRRGVKSGGDFQEFSCKLYDQLIDPVRDYLDDVDQLIIISDEQLDGFAFELLQDNNGRYLIEDYSIKYKLSVMDEDHNNFSSNNYSLLAVASGFNSDSLCDKGQIRCSPKPSHSPLPHSIKEVVNIGCYFKHNDFNTTIITSSEATKANFIKSIPKHNIIHIATHGISNETYGSGLFFSQSDEDSGFLGLNELYQFDLETDLVTLSACKTGVGKVQVGEGVMSLPRGFLCAGAKNVIATLWDINDREASRMMALFYKYLLRENVSYARALQLAKIEMIKQDALPLDWSGFILISE